MTKHAMGDTVPFYQPENESLKTLVRDTQFNRLIRGDIEPMKPEIRDMEWLFGHKHHLKVERTSKTFIWFRCSECHHQHMMHRRRYRRMLNASRA